MFLEGDKRVRGPIGNPMNEIAQDRLACLDARIDRYHQLEKPCCTHQDEQNT